MKIAFKRRKIAIRIGRALNYRQYPVNGCIVRAAGPISTMKQACIAFGFQNAMKIAFKRRNIAIRSESAHNFRRNRVNVYDLRAAVLVSTMKQACIAFGV